MFFLRIETMEGVDMFGFILQAACLTGPVDEQLESRLLMTAYAPSEVVGKWQESPGPDINVGGIPGIQIGWHANTTDGSGVSAFDPNSVDHLEAMETVERSTDQIHWAAVATPGNPILGLRANYFQDPTAARDVNYYYRVTSTDNNTPPQSATSASVLAADWATGDIGTSTGGSGAVSDDGSTVTLQSAGNGIASSGDDIRVVYRPMSGDGQIIARVLPFQNAALAGITFREGTAKGAKSVTFSLAADLSAKLQVRSVTNGGVSTRLSPAPSADSTWIKLVRAGVSFTAYRSSDGVTWTKIIQANKIMQQTLDIGLVLAANGQGTTLNTVAFDNIAATSNSQSATTQTTAAASTALAAPTGLQVTGGRTRVVHLQWSQVDGATGYVIERGDGDSPSTWAQVGATGNVAELNTIRFGSNAITFSDVGVNEHSTYSYRVRTAGGGVNSDPSPTAVVTTADLKSFFNDGAAQATSPGNGVSEDAFNVNIDSFLSSNSPFYHSNYKDPLGDVAHADMIGEAKSLYEAGYRTFTFDQEKQIWNDAPGDYDTANDVYKYVFSTDLRSASTLTKAYTGLYDLNVGAAIVNNTINMLKTYAQWFREGMSQATNYDAGSPGKVGLYYGAILSFGGDTSNPNEILQWHRAEDYTRGYVTDSVDNPVSYDAGHDLTTSNSTTPNRNAFDFVATCFYQEGNNPLSAVSALPLDIGADLVNQEIQNVEQTRLNLPVYEFVNPTYVFGIQSGGTLPTAVWKENLAEVRRGADGMIVFNEPLSQIDPQAALPAFLAATNGPAIAPTNVQMKPGGMHLSWTNNDTDSYSIVIERSVGDALHFVPVGGVTAGVSAWDDPSISVGTRYYYRVRDVNGFGNSATSPIASAQATRDATAINQTETFELANLLFGAGGVQRNPYSNTNNFFQIDHFAQELWIQFSNVLFMGNETTLTLNTAAPTDTQIEVWMDRIPDNGVPTLGTLTVPGTTNYGIFASSSHSLPTTVAPGKHNVYFRVPIRASSGFAAFAWFQFS